MAVNVSGLAALAAKKGWTLQGSLDANNQGTWVNNATGQSVYGTFSPIGAVVKFKDKTGASKFMDPQGAVKSDNFVGGHSAGEILKDAALAGGVALSGGALAGMLGGGELAAGAGAADAAGDTVTDTLPITGSPETLDADGLVTSTAGPSAGSSFFGKYGVPLLTGAGKALAGMGQAGQQKDMLNEEIASKEGSEDPFRDQTHQANDLARVNLLEGLSYSPRTIQPDPHYASSVPKTSGGLTFNEDPNFKGDMSGLYSSIESGQGAPTMTDPSNYGKTGAVNLLDLLNAKRRLQSGVGAAGNAMSLSTE